MPKDPTIERLHSACMVLGFSHPHFLLVHAKIRDNYVLSTGKDSIGTMGITSSGRILVDPEFVKTLDREECAGVLAHEMLHLILQHHGRKGGRDAWMWNVAADMAINHALHADGIKLPKEALQVPNDYNGDIYTEAIFEYLQKNPNKMPKQPDGPAKPGAGCAVIDDGPPKDGPDWKQVAVEARALAQSVGKGTSGVSSLLAPRQSKINWKKVIRHSFNVACSEPGRDYQTFQKRHRRSPTNGPQFPGWLGFKPRIAVVVDVSGSMDREWINQIVSEIKNLMRTFAGVNVYLVAHTSDVVWKGWVNQSTQTKISEAVSFSGGTDPIPAYEEIRSVGRFDAMCHFTDGDFYGEWPEIPSKTTLIVGLFKLEPICKPPARAHVIQCEHPK